jgi:hypothetical protein
VPYFGKDQLFARRWQFAGTGPITDIMAQSL